MEEQTYLPEELLGKQFVDITRLRGFGRFKPDDIPEKVNENMENEKENKKG